jgi:hypothetical protein
MTNLRLAIAFISVFVFNFAIGQNQERYAELVKEARAQYESKAYINSAETYRRAFIQFDGKAYPDDRYDAACSYSLAGNVDTSFYHLFRLANDSDYKNYGHITTDFDLDTLHNDKRWDELISIVKTNKAEAEKYLDKPLVAMLDSIYHDDQKYRRQIGDIEAEYGRDSDEMRAHWRLIHEKDSANLLKITSILDDRGWLGSDVVGAQGNSTLFLVIQHADIETQLQYLPMMRQAVEDGNARGSSLALLEDRVALRQGERQIYGSQIGRDIETGEHYVSPLIDPDNVNKRRAKVGLGTIEDYITHWNMTWDVEKHKARTAKFEAEQDK